MNQFGGDTELVALADSLPDAVFLVDDVGRIRYVNAVCEEMLGYKQSQIIDQIMMDLVVPDDRNKTRKEAARVLAGNKRVGFENRYRHQDGSDIVLSWSARRLPAQLLRVGVARDITALRQEMTLPDVLAAPAKYAVGAEILAPYERRVLNLLLTEATEKQIADRLGLAVSTTHTYITAIYRKFGVRGRAGLLSYWLRYFRGA